MGEQANHGVEFEVEGIPVPQPRPRGRRSAKHKYFYSSDDKVLRWKDRIRCQYEQAKLKKFEGPVTLRCWFYFDRPANKKKLPSHDGRFPHVSAPDIDNLLKSVMDALIGYAWDNDSKVCNVIASKWHTEVGGYPRVLIQILPFSTE